MPITEKIDIKSLSDELNKLIDTVGSNYGPLLIKELQGRMDKTIDMFNKEVLELFEVSFKNHKDKMDACKEILNEEKK